MLVFSSTISSYLYKMSPLTIYKASAGSGKTYQLTLGYLELLFKDPASYRRILAVTFTNKAASEMKSRILERLYAISRLKENEASDDVDKLIGLTGLSRETLITRAGGFLVRILNDYSRFSVGTIDRFFQGVIRAFTREIGLPVGFSLELDRDRILGEAVDRMFMDLGDDKDLLEWMLRLAESRIEASRGWNFRSEIISLGEQLFSESFQEVMMDKEGTLTREHLKLFIQEIETLDATIRKEIRDIAEEKLVLMDRAGYTPDNFMRKSVGPAGFFGKVISEERYTMTTSQKLAMTDPSKWISKNENDQAKMVLVETELMPGLCAAYDKIVLYNSVKEVGKYIFALGILGDISTRILDITDEKNLFLLSDASRFLKGLIGNNPTPFIYEKTGNTIDHIMLDEFQDTSVFQWENFRPLLDHTISTGKSNIVVGDVKQSIYRWRNSDWKILADVVGKAFPLHDVHEEQLAENWRSSELIIKFNNTLFSHAPKIIRSLIDNALEGASVSEEFTDYWGNLLEIAYQEVEQKIPEKSVGTVGYVRAEVLSEEGKKQQELALEKIPGWIAEMQNAGFKAGDIAILVRTNKEGADVAGLLMDLAKNQSGSGYNYNFVSNESLFIASNTSIRFMVTILKYLRDDRDELNNISARYYHRLLVAEASDDPSLALIPNLDLKEELGEKFVSRIHELKRLPLFELTENIIDIFSLDTRTVDLPYIQAFQEIILDIQQDEPGSLHDFIIYWDEFGKKKSITISEDQDAIRIITIHKAKGLQFKAVIVPFCNWDLTTSASGYNDTILWCDTAGTPFDSIPVVPVKFKKDIRETIFASNYLEELIMGYVDSLNMLYVALTRAEEAMIIGLPDPDFEANPKKSGQLIMHAALHARQPGSERQMDLVSLIEDNGFEIGELRNSSVEKAVQPEPWIIGSYPVKFRPDKVRLRLKSSDYFTKPEGTGTDHLDFGNIMHEIFGLIRTPADIEMAVNRYRRDGFIRKPDAERLTKLISEKISIPDVAWWFSEELVVLNERSIISEGETYRPDRVILSKQKTIVIDYKFGDTELAKYERQVGKYVDLLIEMGYERIEGYIWYVMLDKIVKIRQDEISMGD